MNIYENDKYKNTFYKLRKSYVTSEDINPLLNWKQWPFVVSKLQALMKHLKTESRPSILNEGS